LLLYLHPAHLRKAAVGMIHVVFECFWSCTGTVRSAWTAANGRGCLASTLSVWASVAGLPYIRPMPNMSAVAGEPLYVACPVAGYPIESIVWQKGKFTIRVYTALF
jgi:hypothetical protein